MSDQFLKIYKSFWSSEQSAQAPLAIILLAALAGCSMFSSPSKPEPAALQAVSGAVSAKQAWNTQIGPINFPLDVHVVGVTVFVAGSNGSVAALDARLMARLAVNCGLSNDPVNPWYYSSLVYFWR